MTRIMMVTEATAGGTMRHVINLAVACRKYGLEVYLVCSTRRKHCDLDVLAKLRKAGVIVCKTDMVRNVSPLQDVIAIYRLRCLVIKIKPDILHLHSSKAGSLGRIAIIGLTRRVPTIVYTPHSYAFLSQPGLVRRWVYRWIERVLLTWTHYVVAISQTEACSARELGASTPVIIIPNGVSAKPPLIDLTTIKPKNYKTDGDEINYLRIGWLGRFTWQKNPQAAIITSNILTYLGVKHNLQMGGDGPLYERLLETISQNDMKDQIQLLGHVDNTSEFYDNIDILLMTSRSEGLPYTGLDAMYHGVPIVGFDVPGIQDLVEHGVTGWRAPLSDMDMLASYVEQLANDTKLRKSFAQAAWQKARSEFCFDDQVKHIFSFYQKLSPS